MKNFRKTKKLFVVFILVVLVVLGLLYIMIKKSRYSAVTKETSGETSEVITNFVHPPNKVSVVSKIPLPKNEQETLLASVDMFMNEYKLPGIESSYKVLLDSRLHDSIKIITDPDNKMLDSHTVIYARKVDGVWKVDPRGGPWCTLEQFDQKDCY